MDLKEARKMYPAFPKTGEPGDKTVKRIRKQQRMINRRRKEGLA